MRGWIAESKAEAADFELSVGFSFIESCLLVACAIAFLCCRHVLNSFIFIRFGIYIFSLQIQHHSDFRSSSLPAAPLNLLPPPLFVWRAERFLEQMHRVRRMVFW